MNNKNLNKVTSMPTCVGAGLVALDVVISANPQIPTQFLSGGSCGNVLTILSFLGWNSYPVARLSNNVASELLSEDLEKWGVRDDLMTYTEDGSTPIIIHRILTDRKGLPKHRFEFRNPEDGSYLPSYKPCLAKAVPELLSKIEKTNVYFFDRINRSSIDLAKSYKESGATVVFEPSNMKDEKGFRECVSVSDIVKFSSDRISEYEQHYPTCLKSLEIQTLGTEGLKFRCIGESDWTYLKGYSIDNVVDAAGAGDWCTAGLLWYLFKSGNALETHSRREIIKALQFSQALSALNCTFEGARGLMYNINRTELLLYVEHIISSNTSKINNNHHQSTYQVRKSDLKISSLFALAN